MKSKKQSHAQPLFIGIDWADQEHVVCLLTPGGESQIQTLSQNPTAISQWVERLQKKFPQRQLRIIRVKSIFRNGVQYSAGDNSGIHAARDLQSPAHKP